MVQQVEQIPGLGRGPLLHSAEDWPMDAPCLAYWFVEVALAAVGAVGIVGAVVGVEVEVVVISGIIAD